LDCGTLLGCIREGRILSHDTDVDVTIHLSAWDKLLTAVDFPKYGLTVKRKYIVEYLKGYKWFNDNFKEKHKDIRSVLLNYIIQ
jgi:phosphorylcholine metabolism protein LicD